SPDQGIGLQALDDPPQGGRELLAAPLPDGLPAQFGDSIQNDPGEFDSVRPAAGGGGAAHFSPRASRSISARTSDARMSGPASNSRNSCSTSGGAGGRLAISACRSCSRSARSRSSSSCDTASPFPFPASSSP